MKKDWKDAYNEAYYNAQEDGLPPETCDKLGLEARQHHSELLLHEADLIRKRMMGE